MFLFIIFKTMERTLCQNSNMQSFDSNMQSFESNIQSFDSNMQSFDSNRQTFNPLIQTCNHSLQYKHAILCRLDRSSSLPSFVSFVVRRLYHHSSLSSFVVAWGLATCLVRLPFLEELYVCVHCAVPSCIPLPSCRNCFF